MIPRVVIVGPAPPLRGGIAAHTARLSEALVLAGFPTRVLSYSRLYPAMLFPGSSQRTPMRQGAADGLPMALASGAAEELLDVASPASWRRLRMRLRDWSEARVLVQWWHPVAAPALLAGLRDVEPRRVLAICHNLAPHEPFPLAGVLARAVLGRAGTILCHSRAVAAAVAALGLRAHVLARPMPPLLMPSGCNDAQAEEWTAARFGIPAGAPMALFAGHVRGYKGLEVLLHAWARMRSAAFASDRSGRGSEARLLVAGESYLSGRRQREIRRLAAADPSIMLENRYLADAELELLMKRATVLALPYRRASQSGLLPLARALGTPAIVTDAGGLSEQDDDALRVPADDVGALARALQQRLAGGTPRRAGRGADGFHEDWQSLVEAMMTPQRP